MNATLAPIACVVTATAWDETENRQAIARQRRNAGRHKIENPIEPVIVERVSLVGHISNDCPRIRDPRTEIVGLDVPLDSAAAGLPCDYCAVPNLHLVRDPGEVDQPEREHHAPTGRATPPPPPNAPSIKQIEFLTELLRDAYTLRGLDGNNAELATMEAIQRMHDRGEWTRHHVSERITKGVAVCKQLRAEQADSAPAPSGTSSRPAHADVPEGYYALDGTGDNVTVFYAVDRPTEGKWAGRTFVKLIVGGHRDQRVDRDKVPGILARIADAGVAESQARYGREIGRCGVCNRTLTDDESRRLGIGPVCRKGGRDQ